MCMHVCTHVHTYALNCGYFKDSESEFDSESEKVGLGFRVKGFGV